MKLGLEELIIVNPGTPPAETSWFLGEDGGIYRVDRAVGATQIDATGTAALGESEPVPQYFLGDDGTLYETR
jgi:hypothetical protein